VRSISEARAELSALVEAARNGEEILIIDPGKPVVRLVAVRGAAQPRKPGSMAGEIGIADDFDDLPGDVGVAFGLRRGGSRGSVSRPAR